MQTCHQLSNKARILITVALCPISVALAQTTSEPAKDEVVQLDRFLVTGSHLSESDNVMPLSTIDAADISRGGVESNVLELLRKQMPALVGSMNMGMANASTQTTTTYGGSRVGLHNMATLVLLNGRRVATSGANARGGANFVDVNQFPISAIDRIDVVTDGASAVYGSDALGGVINVILKQNYNGSEVGGRYAFSTRNGDYSEKSSYFTTGVSNSRVSVFASGNYFKSTPIYQSDRYFSNMAATTSYSGVVGSYLLNPAYGSPSQVVPVGTAATATSMTSLVNSGVYSSGVPGVNLADDVTLLTQQDNRSLYTGLNVKLFGKRLEAFGDFLFSKEKSFSQLGAQSVVFNGSGSNPQQITAGEPYNPTTTSLSPVFRYLPAPRRYDSDATQQRITTGFRGEIAPTWTWETGYTASKEKLNTQISNVLFTPNLDLAVMGGYDQNGNQVAGGRYSRVYTNFSAPAVPFNMTTAQATAWLASQRTTSNTVLQPALDPFASSSGIDPASLANVMGASHADFIGSLHSVDLVVRGEAFQLPAGPLAVALGGDRRVEGLKGMPDENSLATGQTAQRWAGGTFFDAFDQGRSVTAGYVEARVPIMSPHWDIPAFHALDFTYAYRLEHYSDVGNSRSPKYGLRWQPLDEQITLRYTYTKAFSAPTLFQLYGTQQGLSSDLKSYFGLGSGTWQATDYQAPNPTLKPVISHTQSVGVVLAPRFVKGLTVTVDYADYDLTNFVGRIGAIAILQSVDQLGTASPYANQVWFNNLPWNPGAQTVTGPGQVKSFLQATTAAAVPSSLFVLDSAVNLSAAKVRVIDVGMSYAWLVDGMGRFELGTKGTYIVDDKLQASPTDLFYDYAGQMTSTEGTMPSCRYYTYLDWQKGPWDLSLANSYIASVYDDGAGGATYASSTTLKHYHIPSYLLWDIACAYTLNLKEVFGLNWDKNVVLRVGINNLTDEMSPYSPQANPTTSTGGSDLATYSPIGRLYYLSCGLKF